jgi:hypothetical protein
MYIPVTLIKVMLIAMLLHQKILYDIDPFGQCLKTSFGVIYVTSNVSPCDFD